MRKVLSNPWFATLLIALTAAVIYGNIYGSPFVFDGVAQIEENREIRDLPNYLSPDKLRSSRPLVFFTFALNYHFGGLNVFGYHLVNVLIHILNGFLVYFLALSVLGRLYPSSEPDKKPVGVMALLAALVFIAHPIETQAVTYTVQRFTSMAAMFYLASVLFYARARTRQVALTGRFSAFNFKLSALYGLSILCGLLAFLSKQNAASLPGAILLVEYLCFDRTWAGWKRKLRWMGPALIVFILFVLYSSGVFKGGTSFGALLDDVSRRMQETDRISRRQYLCTQFNVLVIYLRLLFFPVGQNLDWVYRPKEGFFDGLTPPAFLVVLALLAVGIRSAKKRPLICFAIGWFFITLAVESSIIPIRDALFEHRLYLPMFGFAVFVPYALFQILPGKPGAAAAVGLIVIGALGAATFLRNEVWRDDVSLWSDVVSKKPRNYRAHANLGIALAAEGKLTAAVDHYNISLGIMPENAKAHANLSGALAHLGRLEEAIVHAQKAFELEPRSVKALTNLGFALARQGRLGEAIEQYSRALEIDPRYGEAHLNLGAALARRGSFAGALERFRDAVRYAPESPRAHYNMGLMMAGRGMVEEAVQHYEAALRIDPAFERAHTSLGLCLAKQGKYAEATAHFLKVLQINPQSVSAFISLADVFYKQEKFEEALKYANKALKIKPNHIPALKYRELINRKMRERGVGSGSAGKNQTG